MAKLIAVWGAPNSGKTSFMVKLAREIYQNNSSAKVICITPDNVTPTLPVLFPNKSAGDFYSVGKLLDMAEFTTNDVLRSFVLAKGVKNIVFLGYTYGENKFTYAEYTTEKANTFLDMCKYLGDYVIVDCGSELQDRISYYAMLKADKVFRLASPSLKSISFMASNLTMYIEDKYRFNDHITVLNVTEQDVSLPVEDAASILGNVKYTIPYSPEHKQQFYEGELLGMIKNKPYQAAWKSVVDEVLKDESNG